MSHRILHNILHDSDNESVVSADFLPSRWLNVDADSTLGSSIRLVVRYVAGVATEYVA